tara:strand:- start:291 stop:1013 length:723 start_codon:yes stop_codon:yes gene_type:complete
MSGVEIALIGAAIGGTFLEYQAIKDEGKVTADLYRAQGEAAAIKGRKDALNFKEEGNQVLAQINQNMAIINAKGGAGNFDPLSTGDTGDILMGYNLREGVNDFTIARDNSTIALQMGKYEQASYNVAAENTEKAANKRAMAGVFTKVASAGMTYGPSAFPSAFPTFSKTSDIAAKENIEFVKIDPETGLNIYEFNYKGDPDRYQGVIAQEVERRFPDAVDKSEDLMKVFYDKLNIEFKKV